MILPINASISFAAAGDNTAITGITGVNLRIWKLHIRNGAATAQTVTLKDGASISLTGAMPLATSLGSELVMGDGVNPIFILGSGNAFVVNLLNATNVAGFVQYTQA